MREGWRTMSRLMLETPQGKQLVADEILPEGHQSLASDASDQLIDARVKIGAISCYHPASSASMGKVVDASLRVFGVKGLRVVDAKRDTSTTSGTLSSACFRACRTGRGHHSRRPKVSGLLSVNFRSQIANKSTS